MRIHFIATICAAFVGASLLSAPTFAQQKTEKQCQDEWRANKAANQAAKITEKDYVAKCKAGTTAAQPSTGTPPAQPTAATPPAPAPAAPKAAPKASTTPKAPAATPAALGTGEFTTEALAKASCPGDIVVWANLDSKIYHFAGNKNYGTTKEGAYMCEKNALGQGVRAAKNEKHP